MAKITICKKIGTQLYTCTVSRNWSVNCSHDIMGKPEIPLPTLFAEFSCYVSYCLVPVGDHATSSSNSMASGRNLPPIVAYKALITVGTFSYSK